MSSTRKLAIALLLLALVVPGTGQASEGSPGGEPSLRAQRTMELLDRMAHPDLRIRSDRGIDPGSEPLRAIMARYLTSRRAAMDPSVYVAVVREALRSAGMPVLTGGGAETASAEPEIRVGIAGGDLDGDGLDDALELSWRYDPNEGALLEALLIARRGIDGEALWSRALRSADTIVAAPGDLTGDGLADILLLELILDGAQGQELCNDLPSACASAIALSFHWQLDIVSGSTGLGAWTRRFDGTVAESIGDAFADAVEAFAFGGGIVVTGTKAFLVPMIGDDHDGDGGRDVVIDALDFAETFAVGDVFTAQAGTFAFADQVLTSTRAEIVSGRDGASIYQRTVPPHPGVAFLWSPGDAVGDETVDLLWEQALFLGPVAGCAYASTEFQCGDAGATDVIGEMIDGSTFEAAWNTGPHVPGLDGFFLPLGDADDDGKDDLVLIEFTEGFASVVISGTTGQELWRRAGFLLGALGRDPGSDTPLVLTVEEEYDVPGLAFSLVRLDGRTGEEVSRRRHEAILSGEWWEVFILIELWLLPDGDGDAVMEPFTQISVYAGPTTTVDTVLESGASTQTLFSRHADREFYGIPVADLNGDGSTDMIDVDVEFHRGSLDLGLGGTTLPGGIALWSGETRLFPFVFGAIEPAGDLDSDGADDILLSLFQETPQGFESAIRALRGPVGTALWQLGDLTEPPPPGTASIGGTVTGEGSAFSGACVHLFDTDFNYLGTDIAGSSGAYAIAELNPGSYKLEFGSCSFYPYASEWYDDQPDFESATVIEVSEGETITGIDADLAEFVWEEEGLRSTAR